MNMSLSFEIRYKLDMKVKDDIFSPKDGQKIVARSEPLGSVKVIVGNAEEIKKFLCLEIDRL